jgi:hypothetical protein
MWRWIGFVFLVLLLLLTAYTGLNDSLEEIHYAVGLGPWATTATQFAYGVFAILTVSAMGARHPIATRFLYGWCVTTVLTSCLAPMVYGGASIAVGLVSGVTGTLMAVLVLWIWRRSPIYLSLLAGRSNGQPRRAQSSNDPS